MGDGCHHHTRHATPVRPTRRAAGAIFCSPAPFRRFGNRYSTDRVPAPKPNSRSHSIEIWMRSNSISNFRSKSAHDNDRGLEGTLHKGRGQPPERRKNAGKQLILPPAIASVLAATAIKPVPGAHPALTGREDKPGIPRPPQPRPGGTHHFSTSSIPYHSNSDRPIARRP